MPNSSHEGSGLLFPGLALILLAALSPFLQRFAGLESSRPLEQQAVGQVGGDLQNIEARLWEDPFACLEKGSREKVPYRSFEQIMRQLAEELPSASRLDVLGVMVSGSHSATSVENRRRSRYATFSAFLASGYFPRDPDRIGIAVNASNPAQARRFRIPFEVYEYTGRYPPTNGRKTALVLWLDEEALGKQPFMGLMTRLSGIISSRPAGRSSCYVTSNRQHDFRLKFIGPVSSTTLRDMVREIRSIQPEMPQEIMQRTGRDERLPLQAGASGTHPLDECLWNPARKPTRDCYRAFFQQAEFYSPTATAHDSFILEEHRESFDTIAAYLSKQLRDCSTHDNFQVKFLRTISTDRALAKALTRELEERGILLCSKQDRAHIIMITEGDTVYGRALPESICREFSGGYGCAELKGAHVFTYPRGLDGSTPGQTPSKKDLDSSEQDTGQPDRLSGESKAATQLSELAEGNEQFDYLRRLSKKLLHLTYVWSNRGDDRIAIGILGSDIYDKLLILRSLRSIFPGALFFTTDLDARLLHSKELKYTRNLIVASAFGFELSRQYQKRTLPFRGSYQTAQYLATLMALSTSGVEFSTNYQSIMNLSYLRPKIFEIGRTSAIDLSEHSLERGYIMPFQIDGISPRIRSIHSHEFTLYPYSLLSYISLILFFVFLIISVEARTLSWTLSKISSAQILFVLTIFVLFLGTMFALYNIKPGEPFFWSEGISIWPTEIIRSIAIVLSIIFLIYGKNSLRDLKENISMEYFNSSTKGKQLSSQSGDHSFLWKFKKVFLCRLTETDDPNHLISAIELWRNCLYQCELGPRLSRVMVATIVFFVFSVFLIKFFGEPHRWIRGRHLLYLDTTILLAMILAFFFVLFCVLDATKLCNRLANELIKPTLWPHAKRCEKRREWQLPQPESHAMPIQEDRIVDNWLDIEFFAEISERVTSLIYYPFCILALIIAARSGLFDQWETPPGLAIVLLLCLLFAIFCAVTLRQTAEKIRRSNLEVLNDELMRAKADASPPSLAGQLELLISRIRDTKKGAFAPYGQQPFVKALILPFGSGGIVAIVEYCLSF